MRYAVTVRSLTPLTLPADRSPLNFKGCSNYIPGATFRGGLAAWYGREFGEDELFKEVFYDSRCSFGPFYPSTGDRGSRAVPLTARSCKRHPGFKALEEGHGVVDVLFTHTFGSRTRDDEEDSKCPRCGGMRLPLDGFMEKGENGVLRRVPVRKKLMTRTALNPLTGTGETGRLYSFEVVAEGQKFTGEIVVPPEMKEVEKIFLRGGLTFHVGRGKTRGLGLVRIEQVAELPPINDLDRRIKGMNKVIRQLTGEKDKTYFTVTLLTDAALKDQFFGPLTTLSRSFIAQKLGLPEESLKALLSFVETGLVQGWNYTQGLPGEDTTVISKGSVFFFSAVKVDASVLKEKLAQLEREGVGDRREDGFGRVRICDRFHWEGGEK